MSPKVAKIFLPVSLPVSLFLLLICVILWAADDVNKMIRRKSWERC